MKKKKRNEREERREEKNLLDILNLFSFILSGISLVQNFFSFHQIIIITSSLVSGPSLSSLLWLESSP